MNYSIEERRKDKMHSDERIINLKPREGGGKNTLGLVDPRLFTGENLLYACKDPDSSLWYLKYDSGIMPKPLRQRFTGFNKLFRFVSEYFDKRNIEVVEIIDKVA